MTTKWITAVGALAATALVAGHAVGSAAETKLAGPYIGAWNAQLTVAQAVRKGDYRLAGRFTLVLRRNGTYRMSNSLDGSMHGRLAAVPGHRLRFSDDSGCRAGA